MEEINFGISEFINTFNQTIDYAYPKVKITGELANFRISKNRWVYFDLKDEFSTLKFFGTVFTLPGPLEEGMLVTVSGQPRLHNLYGFSVNVINIKPSGEGSIKKAAQLLKIKLEKEGLFDESRKRLLPYPPTNIGLITSKQSAAYSDFIKIINTRWHGTKINLIDSQVQGEPAEDQIIKALEHLNTNVQDLEVIVIIRGGGSPEDLAVFNSELLTRAIAASRTPTLVGIGHENDISLAELAADKRASTPSNAAELLVPDKTQLIREKSLDKIYLKELVNLVLLKAQKTNEAHLLEIDDYIDTIIKNLENSISINSNIIDAYNPKKILNRGYSLIRGIDDQLIKDARVVKTRQQVKLEFAKGKASATINSVSSEV